MIRRRLAPRCLNNSPLTTMSQPEASTADSGGRNKGETQPDRPIRLPQNQDHGHGGQAD